MPHEVGRRHREGVRTVAQGLRIYRERVVAREVDGRRRIDRIGHGGYATSRHVDRHRDRASDRGGGGAYLD